MFRYPRSENDLKECKIKHQDAASLTECYQIRFGRLSSRCPRLFLIGLIFCAFFLAITRAAEADRFYGGELGPDKSAALNRCSGGPPTIAGTLIEQAALGFRDRAWFYADLAYGAMQVQYYLQYGLILPNPPQSPVMQAFEARVKTEGFWTASAGNLVESVNPYEIGKNWAEPVVDDGIALYFGGEFQGRFGYQMGGIGLDALVGMAPRGLSPPARMPSSRSALAIRPSSGLVAEVFSAQGEFVGYTPFKVRSTSPIEPSPGAMVPRAGASIGLPAPAHPSRAALIQRPLKELPYTKLTDEFGGTRPDIRAHPFVYRYYPAVGDQQIAHVKAALTDIPNPTTITIRGVADTRSPGTNARWRVMFKPAKFRDAYELAKSVGTNDAQNWYLMKYTQEYSVGQKWSYLDYHFAFNPVTGQVVPHYFKPENCILHER